ncbi:hypothetical protein XB05_21160 [Xanthomonas arboricola]|nr:hypothetical protein XB05_21160 [Xanthomonas arboricola]
MHDGAAEGMQSGGFETAMQIDALACRKAQCASVPVTWRMQDQADSQAPGHYPGMLRRCAATPVT